MNDVNYPNISNPRKRAFHAKARELLTELSIKTCGMCGRYIGGDCKARWLSSTDLIGCWVPKNAIWIDDEQPEPYGG